MEAQSKSAHAVPSAVLAEEYEKHWGLLKEAIQEENEDEARSSDIQPTGGPKDRTEKYRR